MTVLESPIPRFHLAVPVDDLAAARHFYGGVLGLESGRSAETWVDWNLAGHQLVTHLSPDRARAIHNPVDGHDVPVPHFGVILAVPEFQKLADRLRTAGVDFVIEPHVRFAGETGEQWTGFDFGGLTRSGRKRHGVQGICRRFTGLRKLMESGVSSKEMSCV
jgi:extradiol dioxygenase family protein